jgi:hypothetical protein
MSNAEGRILLRVQFANGEARPNAFDAQNTETSALTARTLKA